MTAAQKKWLAVILLMAAVLRLPGVLADPVVSVDESRYLRLASAATDSPQVLLRHVYHPAYPAALVPVVAVAPDAPERPARLLSLLLGLVAVACCFGLARERFGPEAALFAAALMAVHPGPVGAGGRILSESLYVPAVVAACWLLLRLLRTGGWGAAGLFGALSGLAYLTRPEGLAPAVAGLGWIAVGGALRREEAPVSVGRRVALAGVALLGLCLVAGPYMASIGGLTRKKATGVSALDAEWADPAAETALARISETWIGTADVPTSERSRGVEFVHEWFSGATPVWWVIAIAAAVWLVRRRLRPAGRDVVLAGVMGVYLAAHLLLIWRAGYLSSRHVWPVAVLALPWLGGALWTAWGWRPEGRPWQGRALAGAALAALAAMGIAEAAWPWRSNRPYLAEAGAVLREQCGPDTGLLATDSRVAYYAGARPLIIGRIAWEQLLSAGAEQGARFIACEEADLARRAEGFDAAAPSGVRLIRSLPMPARRGRPAGRFLVYEILKIQ